MKEYFQLQFKIINRKIIEVGIPLLVGYVGAPVVFVVLANYLFSKTDYASYLFAFVAVSVVAKHSEPRRYDTLTQKILSQIFTTFVTKICANSICKALRTK